MRTVSFGWTGAEVGAVGFGAWSLSGAYGDVDEEVALATIDAALEAGTTMIDTADAYGLGHNEKLVGRALAGRRDRVFLATKVGWVGGESKPAIDGRPERMQAALEASLARLGVDHVDLWYLHRRDPNVPIEETVGGMAALVEQGKARFLGLSEVGPSSLRRANAVHPIAALQSEYSLFTREPEQTVMPVTRELGIAFVAFCPLSRGLLSGSAELQGEDDWRREWPRFSPSALAANLERVSPLQRVAAARGATSAQIALAWLCARGVIPIPGTRTPSRVVENAAAAAISLGEDEIAELDAAFPPGAAVGERYGAEHARLLDAST